MHEELSKVIKGYSKLSDADRKEFNKRVTQPGVELGRIDEEIRKSEKITMGPLGGGCPCCGR